MKHPLQLFALLVLGFYALLWGALLFAGSVAATTVLVSVLLVGIVAVRPGWNIKPSQLDGRMARLVGLLLASGVLAAFGLRLFNIPVPYDMATLNLLAMLPGILLVTGMEELLFRQVMYRWLEQRRVSGRLLVLATALAFACAHFGPLVTHTSALQTFVLLQSFYMAWVGWLLGETRRVTNSWLMSWAGHGCYNLLVLTTLKFLS